MRWGVEKRLTFIEFRLFWEGGINRADIIGQFGVSVPQASKDLRLYSENAPGNLVYDKSAKRYLAAVDFAPVFLRPESDSYLAQLRSESNPAGTPQESWLASAPDCGVMPVPYRRIDAHVLRRIVAAARENRSMEIRYQSMNPQRPLPLWRRVTPHAFGNDGLRWHARAFCHIDEKFKDFILSRCLDVRSEGPAGRRAEADTYWFERFAVTVEPNPQLNEDQRKVIARDFRMEHGKASIPVRKAMLYYFQKRLRLDVSGKLDEPHETPIIVSNRAEFDAALREAMSCSRH